MVVSKKQHRNPIRKVKYEMKKILTFFAISALLFGLGVNAQGFEDKPEFKLEGDAVKGGEKYKIFCVACHGPTGKGDGVAAAALDPKAAMPWWGVAYAAGMEKLSITRIRQ